MKLGISTYAFNWAIGIPWLPAMMPEKPMDAYAFLSKAAGLGVRLVQIADNLPLHRYSSQERRELARLSAELGIEVEVGTRGIMPGNIEIYLEIAREFRSSILRVVIDSEGHEPDPPEAISILRPLLPEFEAAGVVLAIENHDRFKSRTLAGIIAALDSPYAGICLDTANSFGALEGIDTVVEILGPHTVNLHLKDFTVRRIPSNLGFIIEGSPAGHGMLDVPGLIGRLKGFGRACNIIVELWMQPEENIAQTLRKEEEWISRSIAALRRIPGLAEEDLGKC